MSAPQSLSGSQSVAQVFNPSGQGHMVLVCEHASHEVPTELERLGLDPSALTRHIAWDPGALETAKHIAKRLDAPLVYSLVSRLVYDCNRPPDAESAIPTISEATQIPGNHNLDSAERAARVERYYRPFEKLLKDTLDLYQNATALITVHSFTPVFKGRRRSVELGVLHDQDARLADALLNRITGFQAARNEPYGPEDGVTHTLKHHALPRSLANVMLEIRNDLVSSKAACEHMGAALSQWLAKAVEDVTATSSKGSTG